MNIEDLLIPAPKIATEKWQLGAMIKPEIREGGIALIFVLTKEEAAEQQPEKFYRGKKTVISVIQT